MIISSRAFHQNAEGSCLGPEASETQFWGTTYNVHAETQVLGYTPKHNDQLKQTIKMQHNAARTQKTFQL